MENQPLIAPPNGNDNDTVGKQKKGCAPTFYVAVSTTILLLLGGLVFYANSGLVFYANSDVIPIGDECVTADECVIPPGLTHGVCLNNPNGFNGKPDPLDEECQSGQSGSWCTATDDCVVQTKLDPPHPVCRHDKCQT